MSDGDNGECYYHDGYKRQSPAGPIRANRNADSHNGSLATGMDDVRGFLGQRATKRPGILSDGRDSHKSRRNPKRMAMGEGSGGMAGSASTNAANQRTSGEEYGAERKAIDGIPCVNEVKPPLQQRRKDSVPE